MPTLAPLPPRRRRVLPWLLFVVLWALAAGLLVASSRLAQALAG
ncbi:MAG: hypothetical protein AAGI91_16910 [Bacteroidota bacterium]